MTQVWHHSVVNLVKPESQVLCCLKHFILLHLMLALRWLPHLPYLSEKSYPNARQHFLHSDRLEDFGMMLLEYAMKEGYPHEGELFLAQAVLQ